MKTIVNRLALGTTAIAASAILFAPSAQADTTTADDLIPCGIYNPGDGMEYYGNCTSEGKRISISQPGLQPWTACVPRESAHLLGDANADWIVEELGSC